MTARSISILICFLIFCSCAQVPKESVELSTTVGRDLTVVYNSHRELAQLLFTRMRRDVNRFIDDVYAPFQIRNAMNRQWELAKSSKKKERNKSLLLAINAAFKPDATPKLQENVLKGMAIMVDKIRQDVEAMRGELLYPLKAQEKEVTGSIDRAYQQIHYANSIVTGHLSSVAKVHETQADLLDKIGVERDIRKDIGDTLARASERIGTIVETAEKNRRRAQKGGGVCH